MSVVALFFCAINAASDLYKRTAEDFMPGTDIFIL